jgi:hypothetical protein
MSRWDESGFLFRSDFNINRRVENRGNSDVAALLAFGNAAKH